MATKIQVVGTEFDDGAHRALEGGMPVARCVDDLYARGEFARFVLDSRETEYGLRLFRAHQPAGKYPHPATDELWIGIQTLGSGRACLDLGGGNFVTTVQERDALVRLPSMPSVYEFEHDHAFLLLSVDLSSADNVRVAIPPLVDRVAEMTNRSLRSPLIAQVAEYLWEIADPAAVPEKVRIEAAVMFLLSLLSPESLVPDDTGFFYKRGLSFHQIKKLNRYMQENFARDVDVSDMAAHVGLSTFYFTRAFKEAYGTSPYKHLTMQRLAFAKTLLTTTKLQMDEVAFRSGFKSRTNMFRSFKRFYGVSPRHFKTV